MDVFQAEMSESVRHYARNLHGRDFVVGDIHGCFDQLRRALETVNFSPATDRLFSVGDLIDRGPQSSEALDWLARPWFYSCMGNHEDMLLQSRHDTGVLLSWVLINGGGWWLALDADTRANYVSALRRLPLAMEIETTQGRVGLVHADIPENLAWQDFLNALDAGDVAAREIALWGRRRADGLVRTPVEGIDRVVCGHTVRVDRSVCISANVWFIDTGAFLSEQEGGHLTLLGLDRLFQTSESPVTGSDQTP